MKHIKQLGIILAISLLGELISGYMPIPLPGSIIGMVILFALLYFKVVKVEKIEKVSTFLIDIMPFTFIPLGAEIVVTYDLIKQEMLAFILVCTLSTVMVFFASLFIAKVMTERKRGDK